MISCQICRVPATCNMSWLSGHMTKVRTNLNLCSPCGKIAWDRLPPTLKVEAIITDPIPVADEKPPCSASYSPKYDTGAIITARFLNRILLEIRRLLPKRDTRPRFYIKNGHGKNMTAHGIRSRKTALRMLYNFGAAQPNKVFFLMEKIPGSYKQIAQNHGETPS